MCECQNTVSGYNPNAVLMVCVELLELYPAPPIKTKQLTRNYVEKFETEHNIH